MKLQELNEGIDISKETPVSFKGRKRFPVSGDLVGSGQQARVYHTGQGVVTKVASIGDMNDSTMKFLDIILKHQDNPFFPKIYHARVYKDKDQKVNNLTLLIQMEKLTPLTSDKIQDVAVQMLDQLGLELSDYQERLIRATAPEEKQRYRLQMLSRNVDVFFDAPEYKRDEWLQSSKNPKFGEAIKLISPYINRGISDLHSGNWMMRLTGHGPQLVIIDPFLPGDI
jgi:hypothetical protein